MGKRDDRGSRESRLTDGWTVESEIREPAARANESVLSSAQDPVDANSHDSVQRSQLSNGALVLLGIIGGVYLLYTWVWFSWANTYSTVNAAVADGSGVLGSVMQQIVFWLAPFAPPLWFLAVLVLNRGAKLSKLLIWLLIGAVLLVPLPMFDFGAAA